MRDDWIVREDAFVVESIGRQESLFSIGNGYLGLRGFFEERRPSYHPGVFLNGFYDLEPIVYGEEGFGFPKQNQKMLDIPDIRYLSITVDGEVVDLSHGTIHDYHRSLDLKEGILKRWVDWESEYGSRLKIESETFVSYDHRHLVAVHISVTPTLCNRIEVCSTIGAPEKVELDPSDPRVANSAGADHLKYIDSGLVNDEFSAGFTTCMSGQVLYCGAVHSDYRCDEVSKRREVYPQVIFASENNNPIELTKYGLYIHGFEAEQVKDDLKVLMTEASTLSFSSLCDQQREVLNQFWEDSMIECGGDPHMEKSIRFNLFQLFQSVGKDGRTSLSAKGLTGAGYEGHYFWDTEIYGMPFFTYTQPAIARKLLEFRIRTLPAARRRAAQMHQRGVLFPWRTINGEETSAYFPAGTAQYHINADITYSLITYLKVTEDESIMNDGGAELLFETARFWYDIGFFNPRRAGAFCIHEVTGPDEYTALVNNNLYTNVMARHNLEEAYSYYLKLKSEDSDLLRSLQAQIGVDSHEAAQWGRAARLMYIPFDEKTGLHPQDDQFLDRERWDFENYPKDKYPLLLHCHPLVIYRYQVLKQADVVLAHLLLSEDFTRYERIRDFHYYEELTTGDSSLSACIQGIVASEIGELDMGMRYMRRTALVDLDDIQGNSKDGLHTAAMGGSWMALVFGLAGLRRGSAGVSFSPRVTKRCSSYSFSIQIHGSRLIVEIAPRYTTYTLVSGAPIELTHHGESIIIREGSSTEVKTTPGLKGAIFDLDGVVTSTDSYHYLAWKHLAEEQSWDFDEVLNERLRGVSRRDSLLIITEHNGVVLSDEEIQDLTERKNSYYRELLEKLTPADLLPGFNDLARTLRSRKIGIGIASASENAPFILKKLEVEHLIDALVPASEVSVGKPDPEIFLRCADLLGVSHLSCVAFEDAAVGIEAIHAAGMRSIGIGEAARPCDIAVKDLSEITLNQILELWD